MLQVSQRAHYGLRAMTELAKVYGQGPRSLAEIAEIERLPVGYLEQLAMPLRRAGLIESTRGAHGGYELARPPAEVTVGDVVRALEGQVAPVECLGDEYVAGGCIRDTDCLSRSVWQRVKAGVDQVLDSMTLGDLTVLAQGHGGTAFVPISDLKHGTVSDPCAIAG
ncbi:MAG: Rrf2 family transcriptional regulator, cysteine metabolism repressor [Chloroflexota bacterium]|jgi:Rrf2 family protein|nr:Rrf2 family transcriptional regulator, cysteine metabolism repressor [Chloroflexota bacterium]